LSVSCVSIVGFSFFLVWTVRWYFFVFPSWKRSLPRGVFWYLSASTVFPFQCIDVAPGVHFGFSVFLFPPTSLVVDGKGYSLDPPRLGNFFPRFSGRFVGSKFLTLPLSQVLQFFQACWRLGAFLIPLNKNCLNDGP